MATLVLTIAGGALGGPIGAALGAAAGGAIDRELLFKPKGREGPRLSELRLQTSSYGTQIPKIFGTMRVAGSVIWATDLIEHRSSQSGKGRPTTTSYSYTASFAVALSGRAILGVGRIWAEGKLLRGSAGDFKSRTGFRLHLGGDDQPVDPLIAAAEGASLTPAHRGIAYAVFEDLELGDFGNRIPSLSFEVFADAGPCFAGAIASALSAGEVASEDGSVALTGFAAQGASVRATIETLAGADAGWFRDEGDGLSQLHGIGEAVVVEDAGVASPRGARSLAAADSAPKSLSLSHYDPERDYQTGVQRAVRPGAGTRAARMELACAIDAAGAKAIAETAIARLDAERERRTVSLSWAAMTIRPGERVTIAGAPGMWRVDRWRLEGMSVALECVAIAPGTAISSASAGRVNAAPDLTIGETRVVAFELPLLDPVARSPKLAVAAAGTGAGWRSGALLLSTDGGASWTDAGSTALPAVLGTVVVPPDDVPAALVDQRSAMIVELANPAMALGDADEAMLDAGANLAMAGDELLQFARAEPLGERRWRLSGLWRGRRGSEAAIGTQMEGDRFVLVTAETVALIDLETTTVGATMRILCQGVADTRIAEAAISGISCTPPSPVHLRASTAVDGTASVHWVRRSRQGWSWSDGIDAPLGEELERYAVEIVPNAGPARAIETSEPTTAIPASERGPGVTVHVRQIGSLGQSRPATLYLPPLGES